MVKEKGKSLRGGVQKVPTGIVGLDEITGGGVVTDLTEQKRTEEILKAERLSRSILDQATEAIVVCDEKGRIIRASQMAHELSAKNPLLQHFDHIFPLRLSSESDFKSSELSILAPLSGEILRAIEASFRRDDGEVFNLLLSARPLLDQKNTIHGCVVTLVDITERKQMEEKLRQSEEKFRIVADNTYDMEFWVNPEGHYIFASPSCKRITGHEPDEFMENPGLRRSIVHPEDLPIFDKHRKEENKEEMIPEEIQFRIMHTDGSIRWIGHVCQRIFDEGGHFLGIRGSNRDITERKQLEETLRESEERYRMLVETAPDAVVVHRDNRFLYANSAALQLYGADTLEQLTAHPVSDLLHPDEREPVAERTRLVIDGGKTPVRETRLLRLDGQEVSVEITAAPVTYQGLRAVQTIVRNITGRKEAEDAIKASEERARDQAARLQAVLDATPAMIWIAHDRECQSISGNRITYEFSRVPEETDLSKSGPTPERLAHYRVFKDGVELTPQGMPIQQVAASGQGLNDYAMEFVFDDGTVRSLLGNVTPVLDSKGNPNGAIAAFVDITERKRAEEELRRSRDGLEIRVQERTREVREQSRVLDSYFKFSITPFVILDKDFNFIRVNEAYAKVCHREVSEFFGHNHFEFYPSDAKAKFEQVVQTKKPYVATARPFSFPDHPEWGTSYWNWTLTPVLDATGEVDYLVFSLEDITKRKRAEEALRAAHQYNRSLIEASLDPLVTISKDGKIMDVNQATELTTGVLRNQLIGNDFFDYFTEPEKAREGYQKVFSEGSVRDYPLAIQHTSGTITHVLYNASVYRNETGEVEGVFAAARDITERKEAEKRNLATSALLRLFSEKSEKREYLNAVVELIQSWSGCRCTGIRILDEQGYIPYEAYVGFSQEFWEKENRISVHQESCACTRVVTGNPDPQDLSMMTPQGSFYCGNLSKSFAQLSEAEKARFRDVCIQDGFLSVYVIPICYHEKIFGAIHLADEREELLTLKGIEFIETMAPLIGEAINRFSLEEALRESEGRLRNLSSQLLIVQETERRRISREIHDSIGQSLSAIKFRVENVLQQVGKKNFEEAAEPLRSLVPLVQESIEEARRIQMDLRPSVLDDLGILATISWFCREFQATYPNLYIEKEITIREDEVPDLLKTTIYRILQEALNNIAKHSKAYLVSLSLKKKEGAIELAVQDNGQGFDLQRRHSIESPKGGFGLSSMRERVELSGGVFVIESALGKGTLIRATWPA
jgi:PAS domain S-box-containing protein